MHDFVWAFLGGGLLGLSIIGYLYVHGKIAGISGLMGQVFSLQFNFKMPAFWFLLGLVSIPFVYAQFFTIDIEIKSSPLAMIIAGVLVGFGTRLGSGCTSGHGICGISRLSKRSFVATATFMLAGFLTVYLIRHVVGA